MSTASFYVLPTESQQQRNLFACKLIEKAYRSDCFCYVLTDSIEQSQQLDDLLWTFRAGSFIPHQLYAGELPATDRVILIGDQSPPAQWQHTVVNLSAHTLDPLEHTDRILEVLDDSAATKASARTRYRHYQQAGFEIATHKIELP